MILLLNVGAYEKKIYFIYSIYFYSIKYKIFFLNSIVLRDIFSKNKKVDI
jgi:hypothetical protein